MVQISHNNPLLNNMAKKYIPNESKYRILIPEKTIYAFQGKGLYEETLEDEFVYPVLSSLIDDYVEHDFEYNAFDAKNAFGMELRVDSLRFSDMRLIELLEGTGLAQGLILWRREHGNWLKIYDKSGHD